MLRQLSLGLVLALPRPAIAAEAGRFESESFAVVRDVVEVATAAAASPNRILVVFDIDNTMMATDLDLGSEHWFMWQAELIKQGVDGRGGAVAASVEDLLRVQSWIYAMTTMHPTDASVPEALAGFADRGIHTLALTSRGPEMRDATLREISRAGIDLGRTAPGPSGGYAGQITLDAGQKPVILEDGVLLTQGQHKGTMLVSLLAKVGLEVDAIVFVDDRPHHLDGVQEAFKDRRELVYTVRYDHERERKAAFAASDKGEVRAQWCSLSRGLGAGLIDPTGLAAPFFRCDP